MKKLFALALLVLAGSLQASEYQVDFSAILGQSVCEYETVVDGQPVKFVGQMTGVETPLDGTGIVTDFVIVIFPGAPAKYVSTYALNTRGGAQFTCFGWTADPAVGVTTYTYWSPPRMTLATGTPVNDEWWFDFCIIQGNQPLTLYYFTVKPYEEK